jgi:hypothetical protein
MDKVKPLVDPKKLPRVLGPANVRLEPLPDGKFYETRIYVKYPKIAHPFEISIQGLGNGVPSERAKEKGWGLEQKEKGLYETQAHLDIAKLVIHGLTRKVRERVKEVKINRDDAKFLRLQQYIKDAWAEMRRISEEDDRFYLYESVARDKTKPEKVRESVDKIKKADLVIYPLEGKTRFKIYKDFVTGQEWQEISIYHVTDLLNLFFNSDLKLENYFHLIRKRDANGKVVYELGAPK